MLASRCMSVGWLVSACLSGVCATSALVTRAGIVIDTDGSCGTELTQHDRELALRLRADGRYELPTGSRGTIYVPITCHVVRTDQGEGGIPLMQLCQGMTDLNTIFEPTGVHFYIHGDIDYIDDDSFYFDVTNTTDVFALWNTNPVANTINVYFTGHLANGLTPLCGRASFSFHSVQGIVMTNHCVGTPSNPSTFAHDIGHYFDLFHTHTNGFGHECVDGSNCNDAGDLLCDTPADPILSGRVSIDCEYTGGQQDTCNNDPFTPDTSNVMSYSRKLCRTTLSNQQIQKMLATLVNLRPNLIRTSIPQSDDCDGNGVNDLCDAVMGDDDDCNCNRIADACDIALDPSLDLDGDGRIDGCNTCIGDTNCDRVIDDADLFNVQFYQGTSDPGADVNDDGIVDASDLIIVILEYGTTCR